MAHAQKPDFVFRAKRTSTFKSAGASVQSTTGSRGVRVSGSNAGYTMFRGSVKSNGYPLHSPVSPSLPLPASTCAITFQLESSTGQAASLRCGNIHAFKPLPSTVIYKFSPQPVHVLHQAMTSRSDTAALCIQSS